MHEAVTVSPAQANPYFAYHAALDFFLESFLSSGVRGIHTMKEWAEQEILVATVAKIAKDGE